MLAVRLGAAGCVNAATRTETPASLRADAEAKAVTVIQDYRKGVSSVHAANPDVKLSVGRESPSENEQVLFVDYPVPNNDPAGRDVSCNAENRDWTAGRGIAFRIKPAHALKLSVSFLDRNGVAYTAWTELQGGVWQPVRIWFAEIRPNPYFQPPGAKTGAPIDVSDVKGIAFAPRDESSGRLVIGKFVVVR